MEINYTTQTGTKKRAQVTTLTSDKIDFQTKIVVICQLSLSKIGTEVLKGTRRDNYNKKVTLSRRFNNYKHIVTQQQNTKIHGTKTDKNKGRI